jgi:hypothetical protein
MKTHTIISFVGWLLKKQFGGVGRLYQKYDDFVVENPGMAVMPTLLIMMLSALIFMAVFAIIGHFLLFPFFWMAFAILVLFNYFRIILREQFNEFRKERQELFTVIKDGK